MSAAGFRVKQSLSFQFPKCGGNLVPPSTPLLGSSFFSPELLSLVLAHGVNSFLVLGWSLSGGLSQRCPKLESRFGQGAGVLQEACVLGVGDGLG